MKLIIAATLAASAVAFAPSQVAQTSSALSASLDGLVGALEPAGVFDPLGLAEKATDATLQRYREAELAHGRIAMLAVVGFLVGEQVEGSAFLFDASISGPAITHITQVPDGFWPVIIAFIGAYEASRAEAGWVDPADCPVDQPGLLRDDYLPGDLKFDPLGLKPEDDEEFAIMQTKELQHGRLGMLAAAGFLAQEAVDGQGIVEHLQGMSA
eukprot:CAMPEP_0197734848 /NCGR_PEP_ID=MMETSP1435-20131217/7_1 /TAXON_ID=426625 /ORGANISM="Chaetoceros brevis, Strain CCMP164" /LENGTH=211 /DNA_ID=CAMNT_0043322279 /DNA_START=43 /DNA_END=678 /DNA_ORIENTATION=-